MFELSGLAVIVIVLLEILADGLAILADSPSFVIEKSAILKVLLPDLINLLYNLS